MASLGSRHGTKRRRRESEPVPVCRMGSLRRRTHRSAGRGGPLRGPASWSAILTSFSLPGEPKRPRIVNGSGTLSRRTRTIDLLRAVATLAVGQGSPGAVAASLSDLGEQTRSDDRSPGAIGHVAERLVRRRVDATTFSICRTGGRDMGHASAGVARRGRGPPPACGTNTSPRSGVADQGTPEGRRARQFR